MGRICSPRRAGLLALCTISLLLILLWLPSAATGAGETSSAGLHSAQATPVSADPTGTALANWQILGRGLASLCALCVPCGSASVPLLALQLSLLRPRRRLLPPCPLCQFLAHLRGQDRLGTPLVHLGATALRHDRSPNRIIPVAQLASPDTGASPARAPPEPVDVIHLVTYAAPGGPANVVRRANGSML
jgi:hypothetical protein